MKRPARYALAHVLLACAASHASDQSRVTQLDDGGQRVPLNTVAPAYPAVAQRERIEGDVQVCFNVDREGRPYRIAVRSSSNRMFEKPSIRAISDSRFQPVPEGEAVPAIKTCRTFRFRLEPAAEN